MIDPKSYGPGDGNASLSNVTPRISGHVSEIDGDVVVAVRALMLVVIPEHVSEFVQDHSGARRAGAAQVESLHQAQAMANSGGKTRRRLAVP